MYTLTKSQKQVFLLALLFALAELACEFFSWRVGVYFTKPLALILLIQVWLFQPLNKEFFFYLRIFVLALLFSLAGDIFLLAPKGILFLYGLSFFLLAQISYAIGFWILAKNESKDLLCLIFPAIFFATMMYFLLPASDKFRIPILVYAIAISTMLWRSFSLSSRTIFPSRERFLLSAGAMLFVLSDSVIAWNIFMEPLKYARCIIMPTYFAAQFLFTYSLLVMIAHRVSQRSGD